MQLLNILLSTQLSEGEGRDDAKYLADLRPLPKGTIKTGLGTRFAVSVIFGGIATTYPSVGRAWQALGFDAEYYGFGTRVQMQVARDGLCVVEHDGLVYSFAKVGAA